MPPQGGRKHPNQEFVQVDTTNILFICGGAFDGLEKIIRNRTEKTGIGFGAEVRSPNDSQGDITTCCKTVEPEDLIKYGLIPEFVGRLPVVGDARGARRGRADPDPHRAEERADQAVPAPVPDGRRRAGGARPRALRRGGQARRSARKTGARGLRSILEQVLLDTMYELPTLENCQQGGGRRGR